MMKEINEQTLKAQMMKIQKDELLKKRKMIKAQAQMQKEAMIEKFETMKRKGKLNEKALKELGIKGS